MLELDLAKLVQAHGTLGVLASKELQTMLAPSAFAAMVFLFAFSWPFDQPTNLAQITLLKQQTFRIALLR